MARVLGISEEESERRAQELAAIIRQAWRAVARAVAAALGRTATRSADQVVSAGLRSWSAGVGGPVLSYVGQTFLDGAGRIRDGLEGDDLGVLQPGADTVELYLRQAGNRFRDVGDDVWDAVREQLVAGHRAGESFAVIGERVRQATGLSAETSLNVARTEVHAALEAGQWAQAALVDPHGKKEWLATHDPRTRPTHVAADGQTVEIGDRFRVGASYLRFPGDPQGALGETINCRCSVAYVIDPVDLTREEEAALVAAGFRRGQARDEDGRWTDETPDFDAVATGDLRVTGALHLRFPITERTDADRRQNEATHRYATSAYSRINDSLRRASGRVQKTGDERRTIEALDDAMARSPLGEDVIVYRGVRDLGATLGRDVAGDVTGVVWRDHGFSSTGTEPGLASGFHGETGVMMRLLVPRGVGAIGGYDSGHGGSEVTLERGLAHRVVRDYVRDGRRWLDVEVARP